MSLLQLVDGLDQGTTLHYKPGESERFPVTALLLGVLTDLGTLPVLTIRAPDGTSSTPAVTRDSTGAYHADYDWAMSAPPGVWVRRWTATGGTPSAFAFVENLFVVDALDY